MAKRINGTEVDEAVQEAAQAEVKAQELLALKGKFFDLLKQKELVEIHLKNLAQKINQLEQS